MSSVSVREFSYNPSAMFARVEQGETIEVTRHGKIIAVLLPGSADLARYAPLVATGQIRLKSATATDVDAIPQFVLPDDAPSPLDALLAMRDEEDR